MTCNGHPTIVLYFCTEYSQNKERHACRHIVKQNNYILYVASEMLDYVSKD